MILALWNLLACLVVSLVCWTFLLSKHGDSPFAIAANLGLLALGVGAFVSAFAPLVRGDEPGWWALLARTGGAVLGATLYEERFVARAQALALIVHFRETVDRWRARWARVRAVLRATNSESRR